MKRPRVGVPTVLDGVFHDGLQRQRRHAEHGMRRVVLDEKAVLILGLFHRKVGAHVLELGGEGDGLGACDGGEVLAQVGGEVQHDLPGLQRVLVA